jgi:hypothetical protein
MFAAGFGTLDETLEITTWQQLGFHTKPVGILNVGGFFDKLLDFVDHATEEASQAAVCSWLGYRNRQTAAGPASTGACCAAGALGWPYQHPPRRVKPAKARVCFAAIRPCELVPMLQVEAVEPLHCLQGFIRPSSRAILVSADTPAALIDKLAAYEAPPSLIRLASEGRLGVHERG